MYIIVLGLIMGRKAFTKSMVITNASAPIMMMPNMQTLIMAHISLRVGYLASLNNRLDLLIKPIISICWPPMSAHIPFGVMLAK